MKSWLEAQKGINDISAKLLEMREPVEESVSESSDQTDELTD